MNCTTHREQAILNLSYQESGKTRESIPGIGVCPRCIHEAKDDPSYGIYYLSPIRSEKG